MSLLPRRLLSSAQEHLSIVEAAKGGDREEVETLATRHQRPRGEWAGRPEEAALSLAADGELATVAVEGRHGY